MDEIDDLLERMRASEDDPPEPTAEALAKREIAAELRAFSHAIGGSRASAEQMRGVAQALRAQREIFTVTNASFEPTVGALPTAVPGMEDFRDRSPITGQANPLAPPGRLTADLEARIVTGEVTFGSAFEGAPGCVHGGFVAALLDEALGMASVFSGGPAMTAELTTRYLRHTPVSTLLRIEARLVSVEGRKIRASGEVYDGTRTVAEASGLFIAVETTKFAQLASARAERAARHES
jgi:acyl-coenzyme A thioesterase PaaI-like protein